MDGVNAASGPQVARILGIDPGSRFTGYALVERSGNRLRCLRAGRFSLKGELPERLEQLFRGLDALIHDERPELAAIEGIFHARNAGSALILGQARGAAVVCCRLAGLEVLEYAPSTVKQAIVGTGRAEKEQVRKMLCMILGLQELPSLDASDALALAVCAAQRQQSLLGAERSAR